MYVHFENIYTVKLHLFNIIIWIRLKIYLRHKFKFLKAWSLKMFIFYIKAEQIKLSKEKQTINTSLVNGLYNSTKEDLKTSHKIKHYIFTMFNIM